MHGNAPCLHVDGEHCDKCWPPKDLRVLTLAEARKMTFADFQKACEEFNKQGILPQDIYWLNGFEIAIERIRESLNEHRIKKRTTMTPDYAWAMENVDNIIDEVEKDV